MEKEDQKEGLADDVHESKQKNVNPAENSFLPTLITTLSSVRPSALWMVTAQASLRGSCRREHRPPAED